MEGYVDLENGRLHYLRFGQGKRVLLAFHGYGNAASLFQPFNRYLSDHFTMLSFDLPHHGKSAWDEKQLFHKQDLVKLVSEITSRFSVEKVSLAGYSMGGRVCLTMLEIMPDKIDQLLLIAPDGLALNPLYYFATRTLLGKHLFMRFFRAPERYLKWVDWLKKKRLLDPSRHRFAMHYLGSETERSFLMKVWPGMSRLLPSRRKIRKIIREREIPVYIFMGSYDRIIPPAKAKNFVSGLPGIQLFVLEKGHRVFDADTLPKMTSCLIRGTC